VSAQEWQCPHCESKNAPKANASVSMDSYVDVPLALSAVRFERLDGGHVRPVVDPETEQDVLDEARENACADWIQHVHVTCPDCFRQIKDEDLVHVLSEANPTGAKVKVTVEQGDVVMTLQLVRREVCEMDLDRECWVDEFGEVWGLDQVDCVLAAAVPFVAEAA